MSDSGRITAQKLQDLQGFRLALGTLLQSARRHLSIFSHELTRPLYHDPRIEQLLSGFARRSRDSRVRILVCDSQAVAQRFHRVLALTHKLGTHIKIRRIQAAVEVPEWEFAIADDRHALVREDLDQWLGFLSLDEPLRVRKLSEKFEQAWCRAAEDPALRRLSL
ncbi:DUF7931 domain-containing protein [Microbulbifer sp. 2201CG32-9]|uniref:DUF7931 domain-containing protein n=1 Tax=Microbulbifer sp. 2201CG32-9 TaxID=3232309 RepID=UPI00345B6C31